MNLILSFLFVWLTVCGIFMSALLFVANKRGEPVTGRLHRAIASAAPWEDSACFWCAAGSFCISMDTNELSSKEYRIEYLTLLHACQNTEIIEHSDVENEGDDEYLLENDIFDELAACSPYNNETACLSHYQLPVVDRVGNTRVGGAEEVNRPCIWCRAHEFAKYGLCLSDRSADFISGYFYDCTSDKEESTI